MWATAAMSDRLGTTLPRYGFFLGVHAPRYRIAVINGELAGTPARSETTISSWHEPYPRGTTQTSPVPRQASWIPTDTWPEPGTPLVRTTDVSYAYVSGWADETGSPWQELRRTLAPLRAASDALLRDIEDTLEHEREMPGRAKHAGLAAVARLVHALGLTRPTILRMADVPSSTFYSWQKNPHAIIRTPTVTRLLQLQAQVAILDEALGTERMRAWLLSPERLSELQGDDAAFAQVLSEARTALERAVSIQPRPRMREADYASGPDSETRKPEHVSAIWPGAAKISIEDDK
jgi:hypothetical protein